jgi:hypothetical protein
MKKTELFFSFLFAIGVLIVAAMIAYIGFLAHWTVGLLATGIEIAIISFIFVSGVRTMNDKKRQ